MYVAQSAVLLHCCFLSRLSVCGLSVTLRYRRRDGCTGLESDHIINAGDDCLMHVTQLLNAIISHGALPDSFLNNTIIPIPKARNVSMWYCS